MTENKMPHRIHVPCGPECVHACGHHCVKLRNLSVTLGENRILEHVSLDIFCGTLYAVIGRNGAGKTTLLKAILGEIPYEGTIEFYDDSARKKMKLGYVPQELNIDRNTPMSVYDLAACFRGSFPAFLGKNRRFYEAVKEQLSLFDAEDLIDRQAGRLSGGQLQRVLIALAAMDRPNLLLLDEPVSGIDQNGMLMFYETILYLRKHFDMSVVLISHDLDYVYQYADQVILLNQTVLAKGTAVEVFKSSAFAKEFGTIRRGEME